MTEQELIATYIDTLRMILKTDYIEKDVFHAFADVPKGEFIPKNLMKLLNDTMSNEINWRYNCVSADVTPTRDIVHQILDNLLEDLREKYQ
jgi:hypothetical protein